MATINLLPNTDISNDWTLSTGSDAYASLDDDYTGLVTSDSSNLTATATGKICEVGFQNFTEDFSAINSVQAVIKAGNTGRSASFRLEMSIKDNLGTLWSAEDLGAQAGHRNYRTLTYTERTTYNGLNAWTNSKLNNMTMHVEQTLISTATTAFTYCYFIVDYDLPVATDNSILFGTNF